MPVVVVLNSVELFVDLTRNPSKLVSCSAKAVVLSHLCAGESDSVENDSYDSPIEPNSPMRGRIDQTAVEWMMGNSTRQGEIPVDIFKFPQLEIQVFSNNNLSGILDVGNSDNSNLTVDLLNNSISGFQQRTDYSLELTINKQSSLQQKWNNRKVLFC